ncbi:MAG: excalibur calcium-binding domain-containing protein [Kineosporiaceae bacterium]
MAAAVASATAVTVTAAGTAAEAATPKFKNCTELTKRYPHGVGRKGAKDKVRGRTKPVTTFTVSTTVYNANRGRDADHDGVACERR